MFLACADHLGVPCSVLSMVSGALERPIGRLPDGPTGSRGSHFRDPRALRHALGQPQPLQPTFQGEIAVNERRSHGALSDGGCDALYGAMPKVSRDEYAWLA
jgi:hypothetical protein